ncbi:unnamed protein product [marine sediment metagenome]|uniref:Uncharacterized protein n=1 Tax=marine sediment metagenome TaxID=412755 RepID=X1JF85_9ZZZZ
MAKKIEFIPSDEFLEDGAKDKILGRPIDAAKPTSDRITEPFELAGESLLPEYLQTLKDTPCVIEIFDRPHQREITLADQIR